MSKREPHYFRKDIELTNADLVREFHKKFGLASDMDVDDDPKLVELRLNLITEEYHEVCTAFASGSKYQVAKELADLLYVAYGAMIAFGFNADAVFAEVHKSNMSKLGKDGKPVYREDGKVIKSDQYIEADLSTVLR